MPACNRQRNSKDLRQYRRRPEYLSYILKVFICERSLFVVEIEG